MKKSLIAMAPDKVKDNTDSHHPQCLKVWLMLFPCEGEVDLRRTGDVSPSKGTSRPPLV